MSFVVRRHAASLGPFTAEAASNLPSGSDCSSTLPWGSPGPRQRPFGPGHQARYPASYPGPPAEGQPSQSRFPAAFRPPALACRVILFPPGTWPFLTVGLPGALRPDPYGVSTFRTAGPTGVGALSTPGTAVLTPARCRARPSPAASQRPVPAPRCHIPPAGLRFTRHQRGFSNPRVHSLSATSCRNGKTGRSLMPNVCIPMRLVCSRAADLDRYAHGGVAGACAEPPIDWRSGPVGGHSSSMDHCYVRRWIGA